jgi:CheY-like chemotaxis protein
MTEKRTILLAEDEEDIRELFKLLLESAGFTVIAVANAPAALDVLAVQTVDLLVTDHNMPEMTGAKLIETVRETHPELPTLLASGQLNVKLLAQSCGASGYYRKGTSTTLLIEKVQHQIAIESAETKK